MLPEKKALLKAALKDARKLMHEAADKVRSIRCMLGSELGFNEHSELVSLEKQVRMVGVKVEEWEPICDRPTTRTKDSGERIVEKKVKLPEDV